MRKENGKKICKHVQNPGGGSFFFFFFVFLKTQCCITAIYTICGHEWLSNCVTCCTSLCFLGAGRQRSGLCPLSWCLLCSPCFLYSLAQTIDCRGWAGPGQTSSFRQPNLLIQIQQKQKEVARTQRDFLMLLVPY